MVARAEFLSTEYNEDGSFKYDSEHSGLYRTVFLEGQFAFKAACRKKFACLNQSEYDFYTMTTDEIRVCLVKPLYISKNGRVIVMELVNPLGTESTLKVDQRLSNLMNNSYGFNLSDLHEKNWGVRQDGTVVVIDYGEMEWRARDYVLQRDRDPLRLYDKLAMLEFLNRNVSI